MQREQRSQEPAQRRTRLLEKSQFGAGNRSSNARREGTETAAGCAGAANAGTCGLTSNADRPATLSAMTSNPTRHRSSTAKNGSAHKVKVGTHDAASTYPTATASPRARMTRRWRPTAAGNVGY